jgi:hypothetical protein
VHKATLVLAVALTTSLTSPRAAAEPRRVKSEELARARTLDREGVKAFGERRYNDAIRYFEEAYRLGGPPFELWNIAKCHLELDQPELAAETLERYLALANLPPDDRAEATEQLEQLKQRSSTLTVSSSPSGALVAVDGKPLAEGKTPVSSTIPPGSHTITVSLDGHAAYTRKVDARYGRAVIVDARLASEGRRPPPENPYAASADDRISIRGLLGILFPRHGGVGGAASFGVLASGTYRLNEEGAPIAIGVLASVSGESWGNTVGASSTVTGCRGTLPSSFGATAISLYAIGTAGFDVMPRVRIVGTGGVGVAGYAVADTGGDLFVPSCTSSPGLRPAVLFAGHVDYAVSPTFRLTAMPVSLQLHPAFAGTRETPIDASGVWLRFGFALGIGVDF